MRKSLKAGVVVVGTLLSVGAAAPAFAAPGDHGQGASGCIDFLYGNATNDRDSGHGTLPSQSPGPWLNNPTDPSNPFPGPSVGDLIQASGHTGNPSDLRGLC